MGKRCVIIAEAGVNHNGDMTLARKLIEAGAEAGVDYVKFQTFVPELLVSRVAKKAEYQKKNIGDTDDSQLRMLQKLTIPENEYLALIDLCREKGTHFLSTPFELKSIAFLSGFNMDFWKVPSGEITNLPYLRAIARTGKPVVMSTGMATLDEVGWALDVLIRNGIKSIEDITVLHCNTQYPTPMIDVNLKAMLTIRDKFGVKVGYSDHTQGIEVPIAAVALGACVIEKHFTLDSNLPGPDHKASLEPDELKAMVKAIRNVEQALGSGEKKTSASESGNKSVARKSIVAARCIKAGEVFTEDNLTIKRPGSGISPMQWDAVLGLCARRDFEVDELIKI